MPLSRCPTSFPSLLFVALCLSFCRCLFVCASLTDCASDRQPSVSLSCSFVPVLDASLHLCRRVCPFVGRSGGPSHYGSKAFKSTHWGKKSLAHSPARSAALRSAVLRSTPLRAAPLAGSFVSEKVAMYERDHMRRYDTIQPIVGWTDQRTNGRTDPLIEMQGYI